LAKGQLDRLRFPNPNTAFMVVETPSTVALMVAPFPIRLHQSGRENDKVIAHVPGVGLLVHGGFVTDVSRVRDPTSRPPLDTMSPYGCVNTDTKVSLGVCLDVMNTVPTMFRPSKDTMDDRMSSKKATAWAPKVGGADGNCA